MTQRAQTAEKFSANFFSGKSIGKNLKEVAVDLVKAENQDVVSRWYHSPNADLFTWADRKNNIIKQQLYFNGQVVEWNCLEGIKTGCVIEADMGIKPTYNAEGKMEPERFSETVKFDQDPLNNCVDLALEILEYVEFETALRFELLNNFQHPQSISTMNPELFLKRYGEALAKSQKKDVNVVGRLSDYLKKLMK